MILTDLEVICEPYTFVVLIYKTNFKMKRYFSSSDFDKLFEDVKKAVEDGFFKEGEYIKLSGNRIFKFVKVDRPDYPEWLTIQPAAVLNPKKKNEYVHVPFGFHQLCMHGQMIEKY